MTCDNEREVGPFSARVQLKMGIKRLHLKTDLYIRQAPMLQITKSPAISTVELGGFKDRRRIEWKITL